MLNEKTIINEKEVNLSKKEREGVTKFHKSRIAFAVLEKENDYVLAMNINDPREHRVYLKEDFGVDDDTIEKLVRGYIKPGKINFYVSSYFHPVPKEKLTETLLDDIETVALREYGEGEYLIGNGVVVGKPGEEWPPIEIIRTSVITEKSKTYIRR